MKQIKKIKDLLKAFEMGMRITTEDEFDIVTGQAILKQYKPYYKFFVSDEDYQKLKPKKDCWIKWSGGECPVDGDTLVKVKLKDGTKSKNKAFTWRWKHIDMDGDIIAYKVIKHKKKISIGVGTEKQEYEVEESGDKPNVFKKVLIEPIEYDNVPMYALTDKLNEVIEALNKLMEK